MNLMKKLVLSVLVRTKFVNPGENCIIEFVSMFFKCKGLLEGLLQHGRLTLKQMVERAKDMAERAKSTKKEGKSFVKV